MDYRKKRAEVHLTYRCDLSCCGCNRAGFYKGKSIPDITESTFVHLLDQIEELGFIKDILIIGGEPTLHSKCLDLMRIANKRGFIQQLWSNSYSKRAQEIGEIANKEGLAWVRGTTHKHRGSVNFTNNPYEFCSPKDLGLTRTPCYWWEKCGYSVDELGITPCSVGGVISYWMCPEVRTNNLADLLNNDFVLNSIDTMCSVCGANMKFTENDSIIDINGTKMTSSWVSKFYGK